MKNTSIGRKPIFSGLRYGFFTLLFSHFPVLLIYLVQWVKSSCPPGFDFVFDSGGIIAIWIPLLAMLLLSLYEVREYKLFPGLEWAAFIFVILLLMLTTGMYMCFFFEWLSYSNWAKWGSFSIVFILLLLLFFSKTLEKSAPADLTESRLRDQDQLNDKLSKIIEK